MSESFDAYHEWLAIAPKDQPPNCYRLIGVDLFEEKPNVIDGAVDRQMAHLRTFQTGPRAKYCQELLNKVSAARVTLLDPQKKAAYDAQLRKTLVAQPVSVPLQVAQPLLVDGSPLLVEDSTVPVAAVAPDSLSAPTAQSAKRPQRKTGPPWIALGVGVLLLGIAAAVGLIMMTGGDDPRVAEVPAEQTPPPKKVPAKPTKKTPDETVAPKVNVDTPKEPKPPADPPAGTTPPQIDPPINKAKEPVVVADVDEPSEFEFPHTDDAPKKDPPPVAAKKPEKAAIPTDEALKKAKSEIRDVFDFKAATSITARTKLTKNILATALESQNDRAAQFAMLTMARDMAVFLGDYATAKRVIGEMDKRFDVDAVAMRSKAVIRAMTAKVSADKRVMTARAALELARELHDADRYDEAKTIVTAVKRASGRLRNRELTLEAKQLATDNREAAKQYAAARDAFETLKTSPDDPAANAAVGKYLCFVKGDWQRGLDKLVKGDDTLLKELATRELAGPEDAKDQVALADAWWKVAETKKEATRDAVIARAGDWYKRALPELTGLVKEKVKKRLAIAAKLDTTLRNWQDAVHFSNAAAMGPFVRIEKNGDTAKNHVRSKRSYNDAVEVSMVARTNGPSIRIYVCQASVILNWESKSDELRVMRPGGCQFSATGAPILDLKTLVRAPVRPLEPNRWYNIRWVVTRKGMSLFVDDRLVFKESHLYTLRPSPAMVYGAFGSVVDIKSFSVRRLR